MLKHVSYFFCCVGSRVRGRLGVGLCAYSESVFRKKQASLNSLLFFLGSVVIIVVLAKSKLCPLWEMCDCTNDVSSCRSMAV